MTAHRKNRLNRNKNLNISVYEGGWRSLWDDFCWSIGELKGFWPKIFILFCFGAGLVFLSIGTAMINRMLVDRAAETQAFQWLCILAVGCLAVSIAVDILSGYLAEMMTMRLCSLVRLSASERILGAKWLDRRGMHSEEYVTRLTSDVELAIGGTIRFLVGGATALLQLLMAFRLLWQYDASLAKLTLAAAPAAAVIGVLSGRRLHVLQDRVREAETKLRIGLEENFRLSDVLAAFEAQGSASAHLRQLEQERISSVRAKKRFSLITGALVSAVFSGTALCALCVGAEKVGRGLMSYGTMTAMLTLIGQVQSPVYRFCNLLASEISVLTSARRVRVLMEYPQEEQNRQADDEGAVGLRADHLTLMYEGKAVIQDLSFSVKPGSFVAVRGLSGIGKTTLIRGILGFLAPKAGTLEFFTAQDEKTGSRKMDCSRAYQHRISYVPQGKSLFSGTIAENLRLGNPEASREEMQEALETACAWDFVSVMEKGMDTPLGEQAQRLSEGQAQRIMLARALLRPCGLLLLDEATSGLDLETEEKVLENLRKVCQNKTCLIVTHRPAVILAAEDVIELQ